MNFVYIEKILKWSLKLLFNNPNFFNKFDVGFRVILEIILFQQK